MYLISQYAHCFDFYFFQAKELADDIADAKQAAQNKTNRYVQNNILNYACVWLEMPLLSADNISYV